MQKIFIIIFLALFLMMGCSSKESSIEPSEKSSIKSASRVAKPSDTNSLKKESEDEDEELDEEDEDEELDEEDEDDDEDFDDEFAEEEVYDPLNGYNRFMTGFNDGFYIYVLDPVTNGYKFVVPKVVRSGIGNFFDNLLYPLRFVNNVLQLKIKNAGEETLRFGINTTIGILGFWDPAKKWFGLEEHKEDFGQTLGYYGVGSGFHIVLPILGPSNLRDTFSLYPDSLVDPLPTNNLLPINKLTDEESLGLRAYRTVNDYSLSPVGYQDLTKDVIDPYLFLRDAYEQKRNKEISE